MSDEERDERSPEAEPVPADAEAEPSRRDGDNLDEIGRESFPASDPPASWAGPPEDEPDAPE
jgi:hypothetical protein